MVKDLFKKWDRVYTFCALLAVLGMLKLHWPPSTFACKYIILSRATTQGAPGYGGVRTCRGLKSGLPTSCNEASNLCDLVKGAYMYADI